MRFLNYDAAAYFPDWMKDSMQIVGNSVSQMEIVIFPSEFLDQAGMEARSTDSKLSSYFSSTEHFDTCCASLFMANQR